MRSDLIVVGFSRPKARFQFFADAIMFVDRSNFSHTYIRFWSDFYERDLVYQASGLKVNFIGWELFKSHVEIVEEFDLVVSEGVKQEVIQFAIDHVGLPYSLPEAIGILAVKIAAIFGFKIKNPISQRGYFCSEMVAVILRDFIGAKLADDDVKRMTPKDVRDFIAKFTLGEP